MDIPQIWKMLKILIKPNQLKIKNIFLSSILKQKIIMIFLILAIKASIILMYAECNTWKNIIKHASNLFI